MLNPETIQALLGEVISAEGSPVEGIIANYMIDKVKLEESRELVREWITELDPAFLREFGGGMSFTVLPQDRNGELWGQQRNAEQLIVLAMALDLCRYCLPRKMWHMMPGGVPYVVFTTGEPYPPNTETAK